jgi:hypothetical protein
MPLAAGPKKGQWGIKDEEKIAVYFMSNTDTCTHIDNEGYFYSPITLTFEETKQRNSDCSSGYSKRLVERAS